MISFYSLIDIGVAYLDYVKVKVECRKDGKRMSSERKWDVGNVESSSRSVAERMK